MGDLGYPKNTTPRICFDGTGGRDLRSDECDGCRNVQFMRRIEGNI